MIMDETQMNEPQAWLGNNATHVNLEDLKMDSNFAMLLGSLVFAISWVIYITYYNSRLVGYIITKIVNKLLIRSGSFKIGAWQCAQVRSDLKVLPFRFIYNECFIGKNYVQGCCVHYVRLQCTSTGWVCNL